jgi:hypothetical protein
MILHRTDLIFSSEFILSKYVHKQICFKDIYEKLRLYVKMARNVYIFCRYTMLKGIDFDTFPCSSIGRGDIEWTCRIF